MEIEPSLHASRAKTPTPNGLRQRQLQRSTSRREHIKRESKIKSNHDEALNGHQSVSGSKSPVLAKIQTQRLPSIGRDNIAAPRKSNSLRRQQEGEHSSNIAVNVAPETISTGREGRQFTVANVGNNGKIFLRPTRRRVEQKTPQSPFVFPMPPSETVGSIDVHRPIEDIDDDSQRDSLWTVASSTPFALGTSPQIAHSASPQIQDRNRRHVRAQSFSTVEESHESKDDGDASIFRVIIDRPGTTRPSTSGGPTIKSILEIPIPSWRLGTPRFSARGTAILRGSSYAGSDGVRSSTINGESSDHTPRQTMVRLNNTTPIRSSYTPGRLRNPETQPIGSTDTEPLSVSIMENRTIEPSMFNQLTFKPSCDDRSLARYAGNGTLTAATPPRLVAEITSQTFLDYDLLSDFFLTFRSFISTSDLLSLLVARLRWALSRSDGIGMIVRVRTFVAIRHWILNYFMDDFVLDFSLRKMFCDLVNTFVKDVQESQHTEPNQIKILEEVKKCWRRTCALFWDAPNPSPGLDQDALIVPGGVPGSRDPNLSPDFWARALYSGPPQLDDIFDHHNSYNSDFGALADVPSAAVNQMVVPHISVSIDSQRPGHEVSGSSVSSVSYESAMSREVVSCSFPSLYKPNSSRKPVMGPRPIPVGSSCYDTTAASAASVNVKKMPSHGYECNTDLPYSNLESAHPGEVVMYNGTELLMTVPHAGSLVRGHVMPPGEAFVNFVSPSTPSEVARATTYFPKDEPVHRETPPTTAPGVKRLLGSVRRALGNRPSPTPLISSPTSGSFPSNVRGKVVHRVFDPSTASDQRFVRSQGNRMPTRIDLLSAGIAEDFKRAIREDAEADAKSSQNHANADRDVDAAHHNASERSSGSRGDRNPISGITAGSQSIVIFDDTLTSEIHKDNGALATYPSIDTVAASHIRPLDGATPPTTPLDQRRAFARRSSDLLGTPAYSYGRRSLSLERTPSLTHELRDVSISDQSPSLVRTFPAAPRFHARNKSSKSGSLLRYASFQSTYGRLAPDGDLLATTEDGTSHVRPLLQSHTLRRRPGGDLRGVNNVGDLMGNHLRRTRSTGSFDTFSERSSCLLRGDTQQYLSTDNRSYHVVPPSHNGTIRSVDSRRQRLYSTGLSAPDVRPSMEKELALLAQIPDDDDGGIESSLLKLEGKFDNERHSRTSRGLGMYTIPYDDHVDGAMSSNDDAQDRENLNGLVVDRGQRAVPGVYVAQRPQPGQIITSDKVYQPRQHGESGASFSSLPLLQRAESTDFEQVKRDRRRTFVVSSPLTKQMIFDDTVNLVDNRQSCNDGDDNSVIDSDAASDISSEMSADFEQDLERPVSFMPPLPQSTRLAKAVLPLGPLRVPSSSTMSMKHALALTPVTSPRSATSPLLHSPQLYESRFHAIETDVFPPTPDATPTMPVIAKDGHWDAEGLVKPSWATIQPAAAMRDSSVHLPYILAFKSKVLAQQFTLVEKDTLNEIDWKELLDMPWRDTSSDTRSWVDFLRSHDAHGVEFVISRFNVTCKWAISEIVLCRNLEERVQTVIKFIHIANHCHIYRNYATLYQIVVALTSTEISRLKTTWDHVPMTDMQTLKDMEILVQPVRNFHNLRAEMEGEGASQGCIPFIGVYTHDLLLNSQKPSIIASTPMSEPLVNFERCRTSAAIVKNLLRLLEASQLYDFKPVEGLIDRVVWMAALSDEEIRKLGAGLV